MTAANLSLAALKLENIGQELKVTLANGLFPWLGISTINALEVNLCGLSVRCQASNILKLDTSQRPIPCKSTELIFCARGTELPNYIVCGKQVLDRAVRV